MQVDSGEFPGGRKKKACRAETDFPLCAEFAAGFWVQRILYFSRMLSAIMAMNSELVGLPRLFWMV